MEFPQILRWNGRWRVLEQRPRRSGFRKRNYVPQRRSSCEHHRNAIETERNSAMRRSAGLERIEEKAESILRLLFIDTQQTENLSLQRWVVDADAASAELGAVEHNIVGERTDFVRRRLEQPQIFRIRRCERVVDGAQRAVLFPYEEWEISHPQ